jgi:hypothetical protein
MRGWLALVLIGCASSLPDEQACLEAQTAMAARYEVCTGDTEAALDLYDALPEQRRCLLEDIDVDVLTVEQRTGHYECAFVLRNLACEVVESHGDDIDAWMASSPVCGLIWGTE